MKPSLRELAEDAVRSAFDHGCQCGHPLGATYQTEPHYENDRKALFAAIDAAEADRALGENVRAVIEGGELICLDKGEALYHTWDPINMEGPCVSLNTLDEAVAALRKRLENQE